jgi:protein-S-isoprenylcysteine O-methyltransferase Ste14
VTWVAVARWLWAVLAAYWVYSGRNLKGTATPEARPTRLAHLAAVIGGFYLVLGEEVLPAPWSNAIWPREVGIRELGLLLSAGGIAFAIWARFTLGRNWSGAVTFKKDHELIRRGPYRWVRHPIYTGIVFGCLGSALVCNEWRALIGVALVLTAYVFKMQKEECLLSTHFPEAYPAYRAATKKLVPFVY